MPKNVLEFKLEFSEKETITPYAGLSIYGEMYKSLGIDKEVGQLFSVPGSGNGFSANQYINPLVMMFMGGGKYIEDIEKIDVDEGLKKICRIEHVHLEAQLDFLKWITLGGLEIFNLNSGNLSRIIELQRKYSNPPMDFADATLLIAAESLNTTKVFSLDKYFSIYRLLSKGQMENLIK